MNRKLKIFLACLFVLQFSACDVTCNSSVDSGCGAHDNEPFYSITKPEIVMDGAGNALAAWKYHYSADVTDGPGVGKDQITANTYTSGGGWGNEYVIASYKDSYVAIPALATNDAGAAIMIWGVDDQVFDAIYTPGSGWSNAHLLGSYYGSSSTDDRNLDIAMSVGGHAFAVMRAASNAVKSVQYYPGTGWGPAATISSTNTVVSHDLTVTTNDHDNAVVTWLSLDSTNSYTLEASIYTPESGWSIAKEISSGLAFSSYQSAAVDSLGNILLLWQEGTGIWSVGYRPDMGWESASAMHTIEGKLTNLDFAMDASGNGVAVWDDSGTIWSNHYSPVNGWGLAQAIESDGATGLRPSVAVNNMGNAVTVWLREQPSPPYEVFVRASRYAAASGWETSQQLAQVGTLSSVNIVLDNNGNGIALWDKRFFKSSRSGGYVDVDLWASTYTPGAGWGTLEIVSD